MQMYLFISDFDYNVRDLNIDYSFRTVSYGCLNRRRFFISTAALCYAEMGCVIKASGADYAFMDAAFGSIISFIFSWCWAMLLKPASMATLTLTCAQYILTPLFDDGCGIVPAGIKMILATFVLRKKYHSINFIQS